MIFNDVAFGGLSLSEVSDSFPGGLAFGLTGTTITLGSGSGQGEFNAVFNLESASVPETGPTFALLGFGLVALFGLKSQKLALR